MAVTTVATATTTATATVDNWIRIWLADVGSACMPCSEVGSWQLAVDRSLMRDLTDCLAAAVHVQLSSHPGISSRVHIPWTVLPCRPPMYSELYPSSPVWLLASCPESRVQFRDRTQSRDGLFIPEALKHRIQPEQKRTRQEPEKDRERNTEYTAWTETQAHGYILRVHPPARTTLTTL